MNRALAARALWASLFAFGLASWWAYFELSSSRAFVAVLESLALLAVLAGLAILATLGATWRRAGLVAILLLAGQFWVVLWSAVVLLWRINGFAP